MSNTGAVAKHTSDMLKENRGGHGHEMGQGAVRRKRRYKNDNNIYCAKLFKGTCM